MENGNRLHICCMTAIALAVIAAVCYLSGTGHEVLIAAIVPLGSIAIQSLQPSALRQAVAEPAPTVTATTTAGGGTIAVENTAAPVVAADGQQVTR